MITLWSIVNNWVTTHDVPDRIVVLVKDLIAFRKRTSPMMTDDVVKGSKTVGSFMTVRYHNKGIEMLELPKILHSKSVMNTIPQFLSNRKPPRVSYSYTKTIATHLFQNYKPPAMHKSIELWAFPFNARFNYSAAPHALKLYQTVYSLKTRRRSFHTFTRPLFLNDATVYTAFIFNGMERVF